MVRRDTRLQPGGARNPSLYISCHRAVQRVAPKKRYWYGLNLLVLALQAGRPALLLSGCIHFARIR
jgi:hypothetical protein